MTTLATPPDTHRDGATRATLLPPPPKLRPPRRRHGEPSRFRPDIQGLRAYAVLTVLLFHAEVPGFAGGFIGVDVFFVISGFLITGQLVREASETGRIRLGAFYARRARRILPPAALVVGATAIAMLVVLPPLAVQRLADDLGASLLYVANWHFIAEGADYLNAAQDESIVLHFWSLAVEEQFYLVWPILATVGAALAMVGPRTASAAARRVGIAVVLGLATAASLAAAVVLTSSDPGLAYMATYTRAWQFGAGAAIALLVAARPHLVDGGSAAWRLSAAVIGVLGMAALVASLVLIDGATPYPGVAALLPTLGTAAVILGGPAVASGRFFSLPALTFVGAISYAWYLWHWPLLVLAEADGTATSWPAKVVVTLLAGALAFVTYHLLEIPLRELAHAVRELIASAAAGVLATLLAGALVVGVAVTVALRLDVPAPTVVVPEAVQLDTTLYKQVFGGEVTSTSGGVTPSPAEARQDLPAKGQCLIERSTEVPEGCVFGVAGGPLAVLFGDSHADQWQGALGQIAQADGIELHQITQAGCPVPDLLPAAGRDGDFAGDSCRTWRDEQIDAIVAMRPEVVIMASFDHYIPQRDEVLAAWQRSIDRLRASGARLVAIADTPFPGFNVPECLSAALDDWSRCAFEPPGERVDTLADAVAAGEVEGVDVVDVTKVLCPDELCPAVRNGVLLYRDETHLTATAADLLAVALQRRFAKLADG